ncbi:hypothetical protein DPX16_4395 [Anabarilius grahami]|uniref:Uncharacterized protein n=1 Tax=Anabarilius grahami TaxID=495550 RepID=A0A3N0Z5M9_ANAGA|nr:hypothetical protein DPX16_4395 [Anabarilius grahami]
MFSSVFRRPFERFTHFKRRRETQQCVAQVKNLPAFEFTANDRKRCRKVPEKCQLGEREEEREVKKEREMNEEGNRKDEPEEEKERLRLEEIKIKKSGRVHLKKREMHRLVKLMEKRKKRKRKITEPMPLLVEVKPLARSSFLKPIGELPMLPSVSEHLALPAACFKPLPLVTKKEDPPCPDGDVSLLSQVHPLKPQTLPLAVPPHHTPAPDELFSIRCSSSQVCPPAPDEVVALRRQKPQPFISTLLELMLVDIEDEKNEYVAYTGKIFQASDLLKSERPQPEAKMKPRKMVAWLEKDSEVQEEVWESEVEEVQGFEEMGDSSAIQGLESQIDEHTICVTSPDGSKNETQHHVNVQEKRKRLVLFTWVEEKAKKKEEEKIRKEKERREKELLLERYRNDPKLKHLLINKHNRNYCSS